MPNTTPDPAAIPDELLEREQWLFWNADADKPRKALPTPAADYGASWTDPDEWVSADDAIEGAERIENAGIGYVLASENPDYPRGIYGAIDLDGAATPDDKPKEWLPSLEPFIERDAYIEWSPSHGDDGDSGLHIPIAGLEKPEWWPGDDVHFSDSEHEGVEVLTHKFCTFTGDPLNAAPTVVDYGEWVDEWLAEVYETITGDDPREARGDGGATAVTPDVSGASGAGDEFDGDEWVDAETAAELLDHINPDLPRNEWRNIGFALKDHFPPSTARKLFIDWSRSGTKWDADAPAEAENILEYDGSPGGKRVTIATVVEYAKRGGWSPPERSDSPHPTPAAAGPDETDETDETPTRPEWATRFNAWLASEREGEDGSDPGLRWKLDRLATELNRDYQFAARYDGTGSTAETPLYRYDPDAGIYKKDGAGVVEKLIERHANMEIHSSDADHVTDKLRRRNVVHTDEFHPAVADDGRINVANGVLDPETRTLEPHTPETVFTRQLPVEYDPDADADDVREFLRDITTDDPEGETHVQTLIEWIGFGLKPEYEPEKFLLLTGDTRNGKGTYFRLIEEFYGGSTNFGGTVSSVSLSTITNGSRFGFARLEGALMNVDGDVAGGNSLQSSDLSKLKKMTGGDYIRIEEKNEPAYDARNRAKLAFAANEPPRFDERSGAIAERLLHIELPYRFTTVDDDGHKDAIPKSVLMDRIASDEQLSGLLNEALDALERLNADHQFAIEKGTTAEDRFERYHRASDPIANFADRCLDEHGSESVWLPKETIYSTYVNWVQREMGEKKPTSSSVFWRKLNEFVDFTTSRPSVGDRGQIRMVHGLWLTDATAADIPDSEYERVPSIYEDRADLNVMTMMDLPGREAHERGADDGDSAAGTMTRRERLNAVHETLAALYDDADGKPIPHGTLADAVADRHGIDDDGLDGLLDKLAEQERIGRHGRKYEPF